MIRPYDERDICHILKYFAQKSECPNFYTFEHIDRSKLDVAKIAEEILNKDMRRSEKNNYLDELWNNGDENILRLFFGKKIYFSRIVESELFKLENQEYYQPNQENVIYGKKKLNELTLEEIKKFNEERGWGKYHTPENLAKSISKARGSCFVCFSSSRIS